VAQPANDFYEGSALHQAMSDTPKIYANRQPRRPHYIEVWAEIRHMRQADIAEELGADKSLVSRWFSGSTPSVHWQERLAALFHLDTPDALFRHPDEDWMARFLRGRTRDEIDRIRQVLEVTFPGKAA
jgi:predicted XRE-type DNA-binding protein